MSIELRQICDVWHVRIPGGGRVWSTIAHAIDHDLVPGLAEWLRDNHPELFMEWWLSRASGPGVGG